LRGTITETNLGFLLFELGETEAAAQYLAHAHAVFLAQLGPDHPYTRQLADFFAKNPR
jgi:hypothetical protein